MEDRSPEDRRRDADALQKTLRKQAILTWAARGLIVLAIAIAGQHILAHAGYRPIPLTMGQQDLVIGYPVAAVFGVIALLIWGRKPSP